jgi:hypothetical protein
MAVNKNTPTVRRMLKTVFLVAALGFGIQSLILHPIFIQLASNVAYKNAWYTTILYYLIDGGLIDITVFAVCYPATAYAIWKDGFRASRPVAVTFSLITACRFMLNYVMSCLTDTGFPHVDEFLRDLPPILLMLFLELLQYAIVITLVVLSSTRYESRVAAAELRRGLTQENMPAPVFPFTKLVSFRNPLQFTAFWTSVLLFLSRELGYHIYEFTLYVNFGSTDGLGDMLLNLLGDFSLAVLVYFAALLLLPRFHSQDSDSN